MAVIELNQDTIEIKRLSHSMSRASICTFVLNIVSEDGSDVGEPVDIDDSDAKFSLGDTELLQTRREVRYTADDGTILFAGKVLPAKRNIGVGTDQVEYTAADIVEFLGNNPCDSVNKYYNRNRNDSIVFEYPVDQTVEQIVEAEFERLVGSPSNEEHLIEEIDWSKAEDIRNLVVYDFKTEGKTWLQLLDDLRDEIPMLAYWFDPRECDRTNDIRGYTLRFFNLSPTSNGDDAPDDDERVRIVHPMRDGLASANRENVMSFRFDEDISRSYDKLTLKGWGHLYERYEKLELGWDQGGGATGSGTFSNPDGYPNQASQKRVYPLRINPDNGTWQRYSDAGQGAWTTPGNVWTPTRDTANARRAFRRYKIPDKPGGEPRRAVNFKAELQESPSGGDPQLVPIGPASEIEVLSHVWYVGPLTFTVGGNVYVGALIDGLKVVTFTGGAVDDWGEVKPSETYYPDYPDGPDGPGDEPIPRFIVGSPAIIEENYIFLDTPLIRETRYIFTGNIDGSGWNNMIGENVSLFWGTGYDLWCYYTAWDDLEVVRENSFFNYEKELVLYEPRFFKYTNLAGEVLRDDSALLAEFADILFELIVKPRHFGSATLDVTELDDGAEVFNNRTNDRDIFMGSPIQIENWKPGDQYTVYRPTVFIQSMELSRYDSEKTISIGFDNPQTFIPLENTQRFRSFFEGAFNNGIGGTNSVGGCGCGPDIGTTTTRTGTGTTTPPPTSTGTGTPPTTTPPTSSSGTTVTNSTSDTTQSTSTTSGTNTSTPPPGSTTTSSPTTTGPTSTGSTISSSISSSGTGSIITFTEYTGDVAARAQAGGSTSTTSTTPQPAELFTGVPYEDQ